MCRAGRRHCIPIILLHELGILGPKMHGTSLQIEPAKHKGSTAMCPTGTAREHRN